MQSLGDSEQLSPGFIFCVKASGGKNILKKISALERFLSMKNAQGLNADS